MEFVFDDFLSFNKWALEFGAMVRDANLFAGLNWPTRRHHHKTINGQHNRIRDALIERIKKKNDVTSFVKKAEPKENLPND